MLESQIREQEISQLKDLASVAEFAERLVTTDTLRGEFESGAVRRKAFCEALDIGESTLSTWLQTGRIPRVAAIAYALWLVNKKLTNEISQRNKLATEPYVIRCRDGYAVVHAPSGSKPDAMGHLVASGIESAELAQEIAASRSHGFRKVLVRALDALRLYEEQYEDDDSWVARVSADLERAIDFKTGSGALDELA